MKKTIGILTVLVLGSLVFASCGGKKIENPYVYYDELVNGNKVVVVLDRHIIDGNVADACIFLFLQPCNSYLCFVNRIQTYVNS